jgi:hypothetical protein
VRAAVASSVVFLAACGGGGGPSAAAADAATDHAPEVAVFDSGDCFPYCPSGETSTSGADAGGDAAPTCTQLQAAYEAFELTAKACNPQLPSQCGATASDPCCPVTVGDSQSAVDDFNRAVARYLGQCMADCTKRLCQPAPSNLCIPAATGTGTCN